MIRIAKNLYAYRELVAELTRTNITVRYKQAYLGIAWAVLRPLALMLIFTLVKSFVGIDSGTVPYPILTFAALMPWVFFQENTISSISASIKLIKKYESMTMYGTLERYQTEKDIAFGDAGSDNPASLDYTRFTIGMEYKF